MQEHTTDLYDYMAWRGDLTMEQSPFNQIDAMILARLVYVPFELAMEQGSEDPMKVSRIAKKLLALPDLEEHLLDKRELDLLQAVRKTKRFGDLQACEYVNVYDEVSETQFAAVAFRLEEAWVLVYRGTDDTLLGWKEDFNMAYTFPITGQERAKEYAEDFASKHRGKLILCGHSKGGNIAEYTAVYCKASVQKRILDVYNFDGPGFVPKMLEYPGYDLVLDRIHTYIPQDSFFGVMMNRKENAQVVHSYGNFLYQHSVYTWEVVGTDFCYEESTSEDSRNAHEAFATWIYQMNKQQRETFFDLLFGMLADADLKTLGDLSNNKAETSKRFFAEMRTLDEESKALMKGAFESMVKMALSEATTVRRLRGGKKS